MSRPRRAPWDMREAAGAAMPRRLLWVDGAAGSGDQGTRAEIRAAGTDRPLQVGGGHRSVDAVDRDAIGSLEIRDGCLGVMPVDAVDLERGGGEVATSGVQGYLQPAHRRPGIAEPELAVPVPGAVADGRDAYAVASAGGDKAGSGTGNGRVGRRGRRQRRQQGDPGSGGHRHRRGYELADSFHCWWHSW